VQRQAVPIQSAAMPLGVTALTYLFGTLSIIFPAPSPLLILKPR
jgi:hypothetical protein